MTTTYKSAYSDESACLSDIELAWKTFGSNKTTREQYDAMTKCLYMMLIECPESMKTHVEAVLLEAEMRRVYFELEIWSS